MYTLEKLHMDETREKIATGTIARLKVIAFEMGYRWKSKPDWLFGGYFVRDSDGAVMEIR